MRMCGKTRIIYSLLIITVVSLTYFFYQENSSIKKIGKIFVKTENVKSRKMKSLKTIAIKMPSPAEYGLVNVTTLPTSVVHANDSNDGYVAGKPYAKTNTGQAVIQIDNGMLKLIEDIEVKDTTKWGEVTMETMPTFTCTKPPKPFHKKAVEDLLCMTPPNFLTTIKNPCWYPDHKPLRCLPYFQVIGMDKSGSTDLFDRIAKHPDVKKNRGTMGKETMWWSWKRYGHWLKYPVPKQKFQRYLDYFNTAAKSIESNTSLGYITGDGTPMDMWDMSGWVSLPQNAGLREPQFITPHLIRHINPDVKLLIILRDPVERLYSDYFFLGLGKMTVEGFHKEVVKSIKLLHACTRKNSLRACLYSRNLHLKITARLHLGFYSIFIKDWLKVFKRDQFLIFRTEDYSSHIGEHIKEAIKFLHLRELPQSAIKAIAKAKKKYVTKKKQKAGKMKPETRAILERFYQKYNIELADILKDKKYLWKRLT